VFGAREMLVSQGLPPFQKYCTNLKMKLDADPHCRGKLIDRSGLKNLLGSLDSLADNSHIKMFKLRDVLQKFFQNKITIAKKSKVIVFVNSRQAAHQIIKYLDSDPQASKNSTKASIFVGQQTKNGHVGLKQKEQIEIIAKFKDNQFNTLIATSVAEEGLDIGEVDLIICYDTGLSPIRLVQRMGRTGRQRNGRVILMLTENEYANYELTKGKSDSLIENLKCLNAGLIDD
jgi:ERCC4-related helicase